MLRADNEVVLDSGRLRLAFEARDSILALRSLSGADGTEWATAAAPAGALWRLAFQGPDGAAQEASSADTPLSAARHTPSGLSFTWKVNLAGALAAVTLRVRCPTASGLSTWSLQARLPDGWKVGRADFPSIPNIRLSRGLKMAAPFAWGVEYDVAPGMAYAGTYPSLVAAMQFVAFYRSGRGLYIGMHDPRGNHKELHARARAEAAGFHCVNWPALPERGGGTYRVPYEAVVGLFDGDYCDAAAIYRAFTYRAAWGKGKPVSRRRIPRWVKDADVWLMPGANPVENVEPARKAAEFFGVPVAFHWYNWHEIPFDTLYPEYFPPKPRFAEGVQAFHQAGLHVMPYINGRLCDPKSKTWNEEKGERSAARKADGGVYTEVYGSKVPLNVMCPYTAQWQEKIGGIVERLTREYGVDGVYIDQIGAAGAVQCFDPAHGHPLGGGHLWVEGYRKMLDQIRRRIPRTAMLTTEENAECWIDQLDALLLVNAPNGPGRLIPLFPAVYSGRTICFGFQYIGGDDLKRSLPFRAKMARAMVWGSQLGWVTDSIVSPETMREAEFLRNLARCRRFGHDFLLTGRFLSMVTARGDNPPLQGEGSHPFASSSYRLDLPSVLASAWLSEEGKLGIVLANLSDAPHEVEIDLPLARAGLSASRTLTIQTYCAEGLVSKERARGRTRRVQVPAAGATILAVGG